jgi:hypothetical protein
VPGAQARPPALLPWLAKPVTDAELTEAYRANALFDAHRDDPEYSPKGRSGRAGRPHIGERPPLSPSRSSPSFPVAGHSPDSANPWPRYGGSGSTSSPSTILIALSAGRPRG